MLYAVVVIYNKNCNVSQTLSCLKKYSKQIKIIVFDNSTTDFHNNDYCKKNNLEYYTFYENVGLSKAYNYIIDNIEKKAKDYLIILDDDTNLTDEYIQEVLQQIKFDYDVLLPIVTTNNQIISPSNTQFNCRVKKINDIDNVNLNKVTAINSGMVIKMIIYNSIRYNEEIFLDYVDHEFMRKIRKNIKKIYIMKSEIKQNFSMYEKVDKTSRLKRFLIYKHDFKIYCKNNLLGIFFYHLNILKITIKYCLEYKTWDFIFKRK